MSELNTLTPTPAPARPKWLLWAIIGGAILLAAVILLVAVEPANRDKMPYGSWIRTSPADGMLLTINHDGTMSDSAGITYTYTIIDGDTFEITGTFIETPLSVEWKREGDTLTMIGNGITEVYSFAPPE